MQQRRGIQSKITNPNFMKPPNRSTNPSTISSQYNPQDIPNPFTKQPKLASDPLPSSQAISKTILLKLKQARTTGTINISNLHLTEIPSEIMDPNVNIPDINWWEMVDITRLDASNNNLSETSFNDTDHSLSQLSYLISLRFANNNFTFFPNSLYTLSNLKLLDMSCNKITTLNGSQLKSLCSLVELDLSKNHLLTLPEEIQYLTYIEVLNLSTNKLVTLPQGMRSLYRMKKLYLDNNSISTLNEDIFVNMPSLEELYIFKNRIQTLNAYNNASSSLLDNLVNLKFLDAHCNALTSFTLYAPLHKLDSLLLSYNHIKDINGLNNCINLSNLDINNNKMSYLPQDILQLNKLHTLNIQNNDINELPNTLGLMTNLVRLNIEGNPLKRLVTKMKSANTEQIKSYLKSRITEHELQSTPLKHKDYYDITTNTNSSVNDGVNIISCIMNANLNLSKQKLTDIPVDNIMNYIQKNTLDKIDLSDNAITNIYPIEHILPLIQSLKELNLSNNNINMFPICILSLPNLSVLNVSKNKLSSFPYEQFTSSNINMLNSNLSYIDLSFNVFKVIPDVIGLFSNLSSLIFANNQLERIDNLQKMKLNKVDTINFANNKIEIIPHKLYRNIPNVKVFVMENNNLKDIPSDLCLMFGLNVVNFYGNAIKRIRSNLLANAQGLLSYLKRLHQYDNEDLAYEEARNFGMEGNVQVMQQQQQQLQQQMNQQQQQCGMQMQMMNQNTNEMSKDEQMKQINIQIEMIEQELQLPNLAMYKRTDLRKQLNGLIRQRARLLK